MFLYLFVLVSAYCFNLESLKWKLWKLKKLIVVFSQETNENSNLKENLWESNNELLLKIYNTMDGGLFGLILK